MRGSVTDTLVVWHPSFEPLPTLEAVGVASNRWVLIRRLIPATKGSEIDSQPSALLKGFRLPINCPPCRLLKVEPPEPVMVGVVYPALLLRGEADGIRCKWR